MCSKFKFSKRMAFPILASSMLAACGGGGGSSTDDPVTGESGEPVVEESPRTASEKMAPGVYATEVEYEAGGTESGIAFLSPAGDFVNVINVLDMTFGSLTFEGESSIKGTATDIFFAATAWQTTSGNLSGTIQAEGTATLTAAADNSTTATTVTLARENDFSNQDITLEKVSATYTMAGAGDVMTSINIDPEGEITGTDGTECSFLGQLTIPDPDFNVYEVTYQATNCGEANGKSRNGQFTGLGTYDPVEGELFFAGSNGELTAFFRGAR